MKRIVTFLLAILCMGLLVIPAAAAQTDKVITDWEWVQEKDRPEVFHDRIDLREQAKKGKMKKDDIEKLLPEEVEVMVNGKKEVLEIQEWKCKSFPKSGTKWYHWDFEAQLEEGYVLDKDAPKMKLRVVLSVVKATKKITEQSPSNMIYGYDDQGRLAYVGWIEFTNTGHNIHYTYYEYPSASVQQVAGKQSVAFNKKGDATEFTNYDYLNRAQDHNEIVYEASGYQIKRTEYLANTLKDNRVVDGYATESYAANGQMKKSVRYDAYKNEMGTDEFLYDASGRPAEIKHTYQGQPNGTTKQSYDAKGNLTKIEEYAPGGVLNSVRERTYDANGYRTKEVQRDDRGIIKWTTEYSYNANGSLTKEVLKANPAHGMAAGSGMTMVYEYAADGRTLKKLTETEENGTVRVREFNDPAMPGVITKEIYTTTVETGTDPVTGEPVLGTRTEVTNYEYDALGREAKRTTKDDKGNVMTQTVKTYADQSSTKLLKETTTNAAGKLKSETVYDSKGAATNIRYAYDEATGALLGSDASIWNPKTGKTETTHRDAEGKPTGITVSGHNQETNCWETQNKTLDGKVLSEYSTDDQGNTTETLYNYDAEGKPDGAVVTKRDNETGSSETKELNAAGTVMREYTDDCQGNTKETKYCYDTDGNLIGTKVSTQNSDGTQEEKYLKADGTEYAEGEEIPSELQGINLLLSESVMLANSSETAASNAETEPAETEPTETEPAETEPVETEPVETEPAETEPVETEPVETEPVETEPVETEPVETEPVETEPVETEPVETEPVETEPVETEPVETQPTETQPAETQPEAAGEELTPEEIARRKKKKEEEERQRLLAEQAAAEAAAQAAAEAAAAEAAAAQAAAEAAAAQAAAEVPAA